MKNKKFNLYYLLSCFGVLLASAYPMYMGLHVISEMLKNGAVNVENYPKYIIPYTPIATAILVGVILLPIFIKLAKRFAFLSAAVFSTGIFFLIERLMETKILVQAQEIVFLESWQMSLCYIPPEMFQTRTWEAVDILLGGYSPTFKIHFYLISVVIILSLLNVFYGFGKMVLRSETKRKKALIIQSVTSAGFLGMCIWACFTAFYRTGEITVSALSAVLMCAFFALLGVTIGVFVGSFLLGRKKALSIVIPSVVASLTVLAMYIGEMFLLNNHLYCFGTGFFFEELPGIVLAPIDVVIIVASGGIVYCVSRVLNKKRCKYPD